MCSRGLLSGKSVTLCEVLTFNYQFEDRTCVTFHCDEVKKQLRNLSPAATQLIVIHLTRRWITCRCLNAYTLDLLDFISSLHKGRIKITIHTKQTSTKSRSEWIWLRMGAGGGQPSNGVKTSPFSNGFVNFLFSQAKRTRLPDPMIEKFLPKWLWGITF